MAKNNEDIDWENDGGMGTVDEPKGKGGSSKGSSDGKLMKRLSAIMGLDNDGGTA